MPLNKGTKLTLKQPKKSNGMIIVGQNNTIRINYLKTRIDKTQEYIKYEQCEETDRDRE